MPYVPCSRLARIPSLRLDRKLVEYSFEQHVYPQSTVEFGEGMMRSGEERLISKQPCSRSLTLQRTTLGLETGYSIYKPSGSITTTAYYQSAKEKRRHRPSQY